MADLEDPSDRYQGQLSACSAPANQHDRRNVRSGSAHDLRRTGQRTKERTTRPNGDPRERGKDKGVERERDTDRHGRREVGEGERRCHDRDESPLHSQKLHFVRCATSSSLFRLVCRRVPRAPRLPASSLGLSFSSVVPPRPSVSSYAASSPVHTVPRPPPEASSSTHPSDRVRDEKSRFHEPPIESPRVWPLLLVFFRGAWRPGLA